MSLQCHKIDNLVANRQIVISIQKFEEQLSHKSDEFPENGHGGTKYIGCLIS